MQGTSTPIILISSVSSPPQQLSLIIFSAQAVAGTHHSYEPNDPLQRSGLPAVWPCTKMYSCIARQRSTHTAAELKWYSKLLTSFVPVTWCAFMSCCSRQDDRCNSITHTCSKRKSLLVTAAYDSTLTNTSHTTIVGSPMPCCAAYGWHICSTAHRHINGCF